MLAICIVCAALLWGGPRAWAASSFELPFPASFGEVEAGTYDDHGTRLGDSSFITERLADGHIRMQAAVAIDGAASTRYAAEFEPVNGGEAVRLLYQESRSQDETGQPLGVLAIDHERGVASCEPPAWMTDAEPAHIDLPRDDRVVNIPLNLLFQPLVTGEKKELEFQVLLCRPDPRIIGAVAKVVRSDGVGRSDTVEVEYTVDFGWLTRLAAPFLPRLSVWFDPQLRGSWLGHRVPLYAKGPTVFVVRSGVAPSRLGVRP